MYTSQSNDLESVKVVSGSPTLNEGTTGNKTHLAGVPSTVSQIADATGGIGPGNFIEPDVDLKLFFFNSEDTPLMNLMLMAKRVEVDSPEVTHYMIDEAKASVTTTQDSGGTGRGQVVLNLSEADGNAIRPYTTLLVKGVDGYELDGQTLTPGRDLLLFVTGQDSTTTSPIVRAVNGKKNNPSDEYCIVPSIPAGTKIVILANSLYETQKEVDPESFIPVSKTLFLQKRGLNNIVSDYFDSQKKKIPFNQALIAEKAIADFKKKGNRTLWASRSGKIKVQVPGLGVQYVYLTEGLRWQFERELDVNGKWTVDKMLSLAKLFFTGADAPKSGILLAGKNLLEAIQKIDYSTHPEIQISSKTNCIGWTVTNFHTVFGDIEIKREPTLDKLGWSNSGALIGDDRLVHYVYSPEKEFSNKIEGQEAVRSGLLVWDGVALKGMCNIWIEGDNIETSATVIKMWDSAELPQEDEIVDGLVLYLIQDCPAIDNNAKGGQLWKAKGEGTSAEWSDVTEEYM